MEHKVVTVEQWNLAQKEFTQKEIEFKKMRLELSAARRSLPWLKVEKSYTFDGPKGSESLADLFQGRSQLIVQHFMFSPEWSEGCSGCSVQADSVDGARYHFEPKGVSFVAVSRAPIEKLEAFKERMGWKFHWVSSGKTDFNYDFQASFTKEEIASGKAFYSFNWQKVGMEDLPGVSVFFKNDQGEIFRTFSNYEGDDLLLPVYGYLDITPKGRDEKEYFDWIKHHDKY